MTNSDYQIIYMQYAPLVNVVHAIFISFKLCLFYSVCSTLGFVFTRAVFLICTTFTNYSEHDFTHLSL